MKNVTKSNLLEAISDTHKDARGFRPRNIDPDSTIEELEKMLEHLEVEAAETLRREAEAQKEYATIFEAKVLDIIEVGALDRPTAIRWLAEAEGWDGDTGYLCYCLGIPYSYEVEFDSILL